MVLNRWRWRVPTLVVALALGACGGADPPGAREGAAESVPPAVDEDEELAAVAVREGQIFVSVDGESAITGGGDLVGGRLDHAADLWRLDLASGAVEALPDLPSESILAGVGGATIDGTIVVSAQTCGSWVESAEFFQCFGERSPVLWSLAPGAAAWRQVDIPGRLLAGGGVPAAFPSGRDVRPLGVRGSEYLFLWSGLTENRIMTHDIESGRVEQVAHFASATVTNVSYPAACVTEEGDTLHLELTEPGSDLDPVPPRTYTVTAVDVTGEAEEVGRVTTPSLTSAIWFGGCATDESFDLVLESAEASEVRSHEAGRVRSVVLGAHGVSEVTGGPMVLVAAGDEATVVEYTGGERALERGSFDLRGATEAVVAPDGTLYVAEPSTGGIRVVDL